jgi:hypothetical protein
MILVYLTSVDCFDRDNNSNTHHSFNPRHHIDALHQDMSGDIVLVIIGREIQSMYTLVGKPAISAHYLDPSTR